MSASIKSPHGFWMPIAPKASILHVDASFKNPKEMSEE